MKTLAILLLALLAVFVIAPLIPLLLPVVIVGGAIALPFLLLITIGSVVVGVFVAIGKLAIGVVSVVATIVAFVLLPLFLIFVVGGALVTCIV